MERTEMECGRVDWRWQGVTKKKEMQTKLRGRRGVGQWLTGQEEVIKGHGGCRRYGKVVEINDKIQDTKVREKKGRIGGVKIL